MNINVGFISSFLAFYVFVLFYNQLIENMSRKQHLLLVLGLLAMFTITATFFFNDSVFHYVGWYMTLYFVAAYLRKYPNRRTESVRFTGVGLLLSVLAAMGSVVCFTILYPDMRYYFVSDSNKLLAFLVGLFSFLFFKNLPMKNSKFINRVATTTFGVLLIHANSDAMRTWLWEELLKVPEMYTATLPTLMLHALLSLISIFVICSALDMLRIRFMEKSVMGWLNAHTSQIEAHFASIGNGIGRRISKWVE